MTNILTVTREDIQRQKSANSSKAPATHESPFTCEWRMTSPDVLDDFHWGKDGSIRADYVVMAAQHVVKHYGEHAQMTIEPKGPTIIRYQVIVSKLTDLEIGPTRGKNPHFYDGFMSASVGAAIHATKMDPTRVSQQRLMAEWVKGYVMHCAIEIETIQDEEVARHRAPYQLGVVKAYQDAVNGVEKPSLRMEGNTLQDREFMKGYVDFIGMNKHLNIHNK